MRKRRLKAKSKIQLRLVFVSVSILTIGIFALVNAFSLNSKQKENFFELTVANWNDGTDLFYQQIIKSNGSGKWIEVDLLELKLYAWEEK